MLLSKVIGGMMRKIALILGVLMASYSPKDLANALAGGRTESPAREQSRQLSERNAAVRAEPNKEAEERDMMEYARRAMNGEMSWDEAVKEFRQKHYGGTAPDIKNSRDPGALSPYLGPGGMGDQMNWKRR
jgi:predicted metalloprotease